MGYRNVSYNPKEECMRLFTWDEHGNRISYDVSYNPYLYIESPNKPDAKSIFSTPLKKRVFKNQYERGKYVRESNVKRLFENLSINQQFLIDMFWRDYEKPEFVKNDLKVMFLDIETYSIEEFSTPEKADHPINLITCYDSLTEKYITFGLKKEYQSKHKDETYVCCYNEKELLLKFIDHWSKDYPDVVSGWNSHGFDIPYIINRITNLLGFEYAQKLSPVGRVYNRSMKGQFGREQIRWYIDGLSSVDYLDVYKRFAPNRESYKLDTIARIELGEQKVDYGSTNLSDLADSNWELFVDYNIQDVKLVVKMEKTLKYVELLRMLAVAGLTSIESAMGSMTVIVGACAIRGRQRGEVIPTFIRPPDDGSQNAGAFVKEPELGFQKNVVSFDANSLYPNTMITLNLSPETKIGKIVKRKEDQIEVRDINNNTFNISLDKFAQLVKDKELSISKAGVLFSQKKKGLIPEVVDHYYNKRVEIRKELNRLKRKGTVTENDKETISEINRLDTKQLTVKIFINSVYGALGNKVFPLGDDDLAESITLTGQAVIKESAEIVKKYITDIIGKDPGSVNKYSDTDSCYFVLDELVKFLNIVPVKNGKITKQFYDVVEKVTNNLNEGIQAWGKKVLNSKDCRFIFKREKICDVGLFLRKKRYVLHVLDDEGIPTNEFKYVGVEVKRTTMPASVKPMVKNIIETMLTTQSLQETNDMVSSTYDKFIQLPMEDVAEVSGIKGLEKYASLCEGFTTTKGMPHHVKAAYFYNILLDRLKIDKKYEKIQSGDKIKHIQVKTPNRFGIKKIAYKYYYPDEFKEIFHPDHEKMFEKIVFSVVESFYQTVGWKPKKPGEMLQADLFNLLGFDS
jgi:DNA polymerase elongation subunit (family B)